MSLVHSTGTREETFFPNLISADQPAFDIRSITHEAAPGLTCTIEMEGDAFEMEDQRNWADASFKTYVRPLSKPRPYVIAKSAADRQRIIVSIEGKPAARSVSSRDSANLSLGAPIAHMPDIALFVDESGLGALSSDDIPQLLIARLDLEKPDSLAEFSRVAALAAQGLAPIAVELILSARDPDAEAAEALRLIEVAGLNPSALFVSPRREYKTRPSHTLPDGEAPIDGLVAALRRAGFAGEIGAGTPSYFTEFNRNPPGTAGDFVFFSVAATVHAADDISVAETLSIYPVLVESARALCPGKPVWLGPCTIGVRHNPYGAATQPNPSNLRVPSATVDPRQSALFGAAYAVAAAAQAAASGVETVTLGAPAGPFGIFNADGSPRPIKAVVAELAAAAGSEGHVLRTGLSGIYGLAYRSGQSRRALIANLTAEPVSLALPTDLAKALLLRSGAIWSPAQSGRLDLPPYRTALVSA
jgi:hypothetical protein